MKALSADKNSISGMLGLRTTITPLMANEEQAIPVWLFLKGSEVNKIISNKVNAIIKLLTWPTNVTYVDARGGHSHWEVMGMCHLQDPPFHTYF